MAAVLNMSHALLAQGRELFNAYRYDKALFLLRGLLRLPELEPRVSAEANFLVAQIHFRKNQLDRAKTTLGQALAADPKHAESHFLMAQVLESETAGQTAESLGHFETAHRLAPTDSRKRSAYALRLTRSGDRQQGLHMLQGTYSEDSSDPAVVANFVEGLIDAAKYEDAELLVTHATNRNLGDGRFANMRNRFQHRIRNEKLFGRDQPEDVEASILPFRNFSDSKVRGQKKPPVETPKAKQPSKPTGPINRFKEAAAQPMGSDVKGLELDAIPIEGDLTLAEVLRLFGPKYTGRVYEMLGLLGKTAPRAQTSQITAALMQPAFMASLIRRLPRASRRLLKSVVSAGGYLPVNVLFQNTGKNAPPADYAQPLIESGILFFGNESKSGNAAKGQMVAVVPVDLLHRIAGVLRVRLEEADDLDA